MVNHNNGSYLCVFLYDFDFCLQFDKDEVQGLFNIGTESWAVLTWSYKCIPGAKYIGRPPDHFKFNAIGLPGMPVLDLQSSACSCTGNHQNIQNSTNLTHVESNSEDWEANDDDDELYTPRKLKNCAKCFATKKNPMTIQLEKEPDNPKIPMPFL